MPPVPCAHCGNNYMRSTTAHEDAKICHNCILKEEIRNPKKGTAMSDEVGILINCPRDIQIEIEEYCINQGMDFTKYFLSLHHAFKDTTDAFDVPVHHESKEKPKAKKK